MDMKYESMFGGNNNDGTDKNNDDKMMEVSLTELLAKLLKNKEEKSKLKLVDAGA